jgi:hypothetical protein
MRATIEAIVAAALLAAWPASVRGAGATYLGQWTIVSVECNPKTGCSDLDLEPMRRLIGASVSIGPALLTGPTELACPQGYNVGGATAYSLFIFGLENIDLPSNEPDEMADSSGEYYDPQKLAERMGFRGFSWKTIDCGGRYTYFADVKHAAMAVEHTVLRLERR